MPENEFEHRVQQKMEEFQLRPSDLVWTEVNRRIHKEKRRRFIFWWFLLAVVLAGGIGTTIWLTGKDEKDTGIAKRNTNTINTTTTTAVTEPVKRTVSLNDTAANNNGSAAINSIPPGSKNSGQSATQQEKRARLQPEINITSETKSRKQQSRQIIVSAASPADLTVNKNDGVVKKRKDKAQPKMTTADGPVSPVTNTDAAITVTNKEINNQVAPADNTDSVSNKKAVATVIQLQPQKSENRSDTTVIDSTITVSLPALKPGKGKWDWEASVSGGRSSIVYGFGKFKQASLMDAAQVNGGGGIGVTPPTSSVNLPAARSGPSWGINVYGKKNIAGSLDLVLGLGYTYYSTRMSVGERVDSVRNINNAFINSVNVGTFYRYPGSSGQYSYTNKYYFARLSAELSWKIIRGNKFSMYWRNGLLYNQLLGSTMLHYDNGLPGFYRDNSQLKKGHLFFSTGLSVPAGKRWQFNPYFNYGLTIVLNNGESRTHYNSAGLRIIFSFSKQ